MARDRADLFDKLDEIRSQTPSQLGQISVVAVDDKGQRIDSWRGLVVAAILGQ